MILAVLERRAGLPVSQADVYVSTVGGIKVYEPATDLAIALAIASAAKDIPLSQEMAAVGEISLAGEIRAVTQAPQRASEAARLGFSLVLDHSTASIHDAITQAFSRSPKKLKEPTF
jgi:DNA repair protein RadA/Sms